ncbi:MAG: TraB/GumN family protein [Pseudomonadota bacterium]
MKFLRTCLVFILTAFFHVQAEDLQPARKVTATGLVYKVEGGKASLFLCGSVHLLKKKDYPLPAGYETAYAASRRLVFEVPPSELSPEVAGAMMAKFGVLKKGTLDDLLTDDARKALNGWAKKNGVPMAALSEMPPWLVAMMISQQSCKEAGMKAKYGLDLHFSKRLEKDGKVGEGFETAEEQFGMLSGFDLKTQMEMIVQSIEEAKDANKELKQLLDAWRAGDAEGLAKIMAEKMAEFPEVEKVLLHGRNSRWIPKLKAYLDDSIPTMVIVGAFHLCGPKGLLALLEKEGFEVKAIKP